jgi:23S rRNA (cytidine1920-2'-O)/16S rRNA (cytidine1409-2'-O)-methyltransferase
MKSRLDIFLCERGIFESRARARAAVMEGLVSVDGRPADKPGLQVDGSEKITIASPGRRFVSRGGIKLEAALEVFGTDVEGRSALDIGASTGGFTECLLSRGASRVIALDVGKGQLHWKLRNDPRVTVMEGFNARYLVPGDLPFSPELAAIDVSFISLKKVILPVAGVMTASAPIIALVKPQFEAGRAQVRSGGVVRDPEVHSDVLLSMAGWLEDQDLTLRALTASPLRGPRGNIEFFVEVAPGGGTAVTDEYIRETVEQAHASEPGAG